MRKLARRDLLLDKFHRGFVYCCMAVTLYGFSHLGYRWYRHFTVLRPEAAKRELMEKEKLLQEGASEILKDKTPDLKM